MLPAGSWVRGHGCFKARGSEGQRDEDSGSAEGQPSSGTPNKPFKDTLMFFVTATFSIIVVFEILPFEFNDFLIYI